MSIKRSPWLAACSAILLGAGMGHAQDLAITEVVDGTLPGGQPKWVEITNIGVTDIPDLSIYSIGNYNNGGTTLGGGMSTLLNAVALNAGESYVIAYEFDTNTSCDPNGVLTCFEFVYGCPPDQFIGPFINGNDAIVLFLGQGTGDGSDATMLDVYGVVGVDGAGEAWETTDGYAQRCSGGATTSWVQCDWFTPGPNSLEDPGGDDMVELMLLQTLTDPKNDGGCTADCAVTYCTAKSGLFCGTPSISFSGTPSAGASSGFTISASPARGLRSGLVLYSCSGRANFPFQGGILCVNPSPLRRTTTVNSGGTNGGCDGVFSIDFNAFASGGLGGNPDPCLTSSGQQVNTQWWGRDSVATGSFLSDALEFSM